MKNRFSRAFNALIMLSLLFSLFASPFAETAAVAAQSGLPFQAQTLNQITNLLVNGQSVEDGQIVPANPQHSTHLNVQGFAANATNVQIHLLGGSSKAAYLNSGQFYFTADDRYKSNVNADFLLQPGDNLFTIEAHDGWNSIQKQIGLVYNNGDPFLFQGKVTSNSDGESQLIGHLVVTSTQIQLSGLIKVDLNSLGELKYDNVTVEIGNENKGSFPIDLQHGIPYNTSGEVQGVATAWSTPQYKAFHFKQDLTIGVGKNQTIRLKFTSTNPAHQPVMAEYQFSYISNNEAYIHYISRPSGSADIRMSEGQVEVQGLPAIIHIYANPNTDQVSVTLDGSEQTVSQSQNVTKDGKSYRLFRHEIGMHVTSGLKPFKVVPKRNNVPNNDGAKKYVFNIFNRPDVVLNNLSPGQWIFNLSELVCTSGGATPCLNGEIKDAAGVETRLFINGVRDHSFPGSTSGAFQHSFDASLLTEGTNTFRFEFYRNASLVSQRPIEMTYLKSQSQAPQFVIVNPLGAGQQFLPGKNANTFTTLESHVALSGQFYNASSITLKVTTQDSNGRPTVTYHQKSKISDHSSEFTENHKSGHNINYFRNISNSHFETNLIPLSVVGDTVFEFEITNGYTNMPKTYTITIARNSYRIVYPRIVKNERNEDQATINSNYVQIEIEAIGADRVLFGREEANRCQNNPALFCYEATNLRQGRNSLRYSVHRGTETIPGNLVIYYTNVATEGASYKTELNTRMRVFDGLVELTFPRGTNLMRHDPNANEKIIAPNRKLVFGIADGMDGRVDKQKHPTSDSSAVRYLTSPPRFRPASDLIWIDAGTIRPNEDPYEAYNGSGRLPYDPGNFYSRDRESANLVVPTERGQLTLKYDPEIRMESTKYLTVFQFEFYEDTYGGLRPQWRNIGGVVDTRNNTITVPVDTFGFYRVMYMYSSYDDITSLSWARDNLDTMFAKGIMQGKRLDAFGTNDSITRGEFAA